MFSPDSFNHFGKFYLKLMWYIIYRRSISFNHVDTVNLKSKPKSPQHNFVWLPNPNVKTSKNITQEAFKHYILPQRTANKILYASRESAWLQDVHIPKCQAIHAIMYNAEHDDTFCYHDWQLWPNKLRLVCGISRRYWEDICQFLIDSNLQSVVLCRLIVYV